LGLNHKLYYNESDLLAGNHFNSFIAPLTVGKPTNIEGTPSIYDAQLVLRSGLYVVDASIGFHFNSREGVDQVAYGSLSSFGPTSMEPTFSGQHRADVYDDLFIKNGAIGNIGQRKAGTVLGTHICTQEANIGKMPPTIWQDWRVWLYYFAADEGVTPMGTSGNVTQMALKTHKGSTAFGNPSWQILPCPGGAADGGGSAAAAAECIFISYFLFGEGAKPGEAGVLAFVKSLA
jgi:hypothetical protein